MKAILKGIIAGIGLAIIVWSIILNIMFFTNKTDKDKTISTLKAEILAYEIAMEEQEKQIKYLKQKIEYFKFENFPVNMIVITKKSIHCVSSLGNKGFDPWTKYHVKELKPVGTTFYDCAMNDITRVKMYVERINKLDYE